MLLGAYTYAILTVPMSAKDTVYYLYGGSAVPFSLPDLFGGLDTPTGLILGVVLAILLGGCVAAFFAFLIGLPVLRLRATIWLLPPWASRRSSAPSSSAGPGPGHQRRQHDHPDPHLQ